MELNYNDVVLGHKKSLQALKLLDKDTYDAFMKNLERFSSEEIIGFFQDMKENIKKNKLKYGSKRMLTSIKKQTIKGQILTMNEVDIHYDESCCICIEVFSKGMKDCYHSYRLIPMLENLKEYDINMGTIFLEKVTSNAVSDKEKVYYAISKAKNGYELFMENSKHKLIGKQKINRVPSGRGCEIIKC